MNEKEAKKVNEFRQGLENLGPSMDPVPNSSGWPVFTKLHNPERLQKRLESLIEWFLKRSTNPERMREAISDWTSDFPSNYDEAVDFVHEIRDRVLPPNKQLTPDGVYLPFERAVHDNLLIRHGDVYWVAKGLPELARGMFKFDLNGFLIERYIRQQRDGKEFSEKAIWQAVRINHYQGKDPPTMVERKTSTKPL